MACRRPQIAVCLAALVLLAGAVRAAPARLDVDDARLQRADRESSNWLAHGGAHPDWYYSALGQINVDNVRSLAPAWTFDFDTNRGQEATPIVVDGMIFTTTAWSKVYAIDARTGREIWKFDPQVPGPAGYKSCCDVINRGPAIYRGKLYISTIDGRLIALDARTGRRVWSTQTVDGTKMSAITGAPRAFGGKIVIGNNGGETGTRGYVSAYDAETGKMAWRFYTVPADPAAGPDGVASDDTLERVARPSWRGQSYESGSGGQVWNSIVIDPELRQVYIGTANPFPWNPKFRATGRGDDLFTDSIVALDLDTGRYIWHFQEVPGDAWDYDASEDMILTDVTLNGTQRPVLMQAAKDGYFYVLDRRSGEFLSADPYVQGITWTQGIDAKTGRPLIPAEAYYAEGPFVGSPGPSGSHSWRPSAYSPVTGLVYIPATENSFRYVGADEYHFKVGLDDIGIVKGGPLLVTRAGANPAPLPPGKDYLLAWDPVARRTAWKVPTTGGGGTLTTGGNLVFQGEHRRETAGQLSAYRADTGERLWSFRTPNAVLTGPVTFSVGGTQYVAVTAGAGGSADLITRAGNQTLIPGRGRLFAFRLGGTASLAADEPAAAVPYAVSDAWPQATVQHGGELYAQYCSRCHGRETQSHNVIPDLRRSPALPDGAFWKSIVVDGALSSAGMISWRQFLTVADAESIRAYVASEAGSLRNDAK